MSGNIQTVRRPEGRIAPQGAERGGPSKGLPKTDNPAEASRAKAVAVTAVFAVSSVFAMSCGDSQANGEADAAVDGGEETRESTECPTDENVSCRWAANMDTEQNECAPSGECADEDGNVLDCVDDGEACVWEESGDVVPPVVGDCEEEQTETARAMLLVESVAPGVSVGDGDFSTIHVSPYTANEGDVLTVTDNHDNTRTFVVTGVGEGCGVTLQEEGTSNHYIYIHPADVGSGAVYQEGAIERALSHELQVDAVSGACSEGQGALLNPDLEGYGMVTLRLTLADGRTQLVTLADEGFSAEIGNSLEIGPNSSTNEATVFVNMRRAVNGGVVLRFQEVDWTNAVTGIPLNSEVPEGEQLGINVKVDIVGTSDGHVSGCSYVEVQLTERSSTGNVVHTLEFSQREDRQYPRTLETEDGYSYEVVMAGETQDGEGMVTVRVTAPDRSNWTRTVVTDGEHGEDVLSADGATRVVLGGAFLVQPEVENSD